MFAQHACCQTIEQWKQLCTTKSTAKDEVELELCASISEQHYNTVLKHLTDAFVSASVSTSDGKEGHSNALVKRVDSMFTDKYFMVGNQQVRQRTFMNQQDKPETIKKERLATLDILVLQRSYDIRMNLKRELAVTVEAKQQTPHQVQRDVKRVSFFTSDNMRIDLSIVQQQDFQHNKQTKTYEMEIECMPELLKTETERIFALLQYWTLFWMDCLPKDVKMMFVPIEQTSFSKLQQDKNAKVITVFTDSVWILKQRLPVA
jgi:hypothetical protein